MVGAKSLGCTTCKRRKVKVGPELPPNHDRRCPPSKLLTRRSVMNDSQLVQIASELGGTVLAPNLALYDTSSLVPKNT